MAKKSTIAKNEKKKKLAKQGFEKRKALREAARQAYLEGKSVDEIFTLFQKLNKMDRNYGNPTRIRNRCRVTGRPRGYYSRFEMSRIAIRQLGSAGEIPGLVKSSW